MAEQWENDPDREEVVQLEKKFHQGTQSIRRRGRLTGVL
jgi:hypothetical protein